jgi:hypothetical protein
MGAGREDDSRERDDERTRGTVDRRLPRRANPHDQMAPRADAVMHLGRRFALGDLMLRLARTVGRTSRLNVASPVAAEPRVAADGGRRMNRLLNTVRELGPYAALALILPGGSLIALAAWLWRRRTPAMASVGRGLIVVAAFAAALILPVRA